MHVPWHSLPPHFQGVTLQPLHSSQQRQHPPNSQHWGIHSFLLAIVRTSPTGSELLHLVRLWQCYPFTQRVPLESIKTIVQFYREPFALHSLFQYKGYLSEVPSHHAHKPTIFTWRQAQRFGPTAPQDWQVPCIFMIKEGLFTWLVFK